MNTLDGLTIVYTGDGKGKTTAALGLALRSAGRGLKILIVQFMKSAEYGEHKVLRSIRNITVKICGKGFCKLYGDKFPIEIHKRAAQQALKYVEQAMKSRRFDMIVLDEVNCAYKCQLLSAKAIIDIVKKKPSTVHLVLTGRGAPSSLLKHADLVSEVKEIKHPFQKGAPAKPGIEY